MSKVLLLAIMAVAALANAVLGDLEPISMFYVGNQSQPSVAVAQFSLTPAAYADKTPVDLYMYLPGTPSSFTGVACDLEMSMDSYRPVAERVRKVPVTAVYSTSPDLTLISGRTFLTSRDILGKFQFVCNFNSQNLPVPQIKVFATATIGSQSVNLSAIGTVNPWSSAFTRFQAYLTNGAKQSVFIVEGIGKNIDGKSFSVFNSNPEGTTGSPMQFMGPPSSYCDAYWDGAYYQRSFVAQIPADGSYISLIAGSPLNAAQNHISIVCPDVLGFAQNPLLPSVLKAVYSSPIGRLLTNTVATSEARPPPSVEEVSEFSLEKLIETPKN